MRRHIFGIAACATLVAGLAPLAPAAVAAPAAPAPGTCWQFSAKDWDVARLPAKPAVNCAGSHTAELMGTVKVTTKARKLGSGGLWAWAFRQCQTVGINYVWGGEAAPLPKASYTLPMSAQVATYLPAKGSAWVACVGMNTSATQRVRSRTGSIAGSGLQPRPCVSNKTWDLTGCAGSSARVLTNVAWVSKPYNAPPPSNSQALKLARKACQGLAGRSHVARTWWMPSKALWKYGDHFAYCELQEKTSV